MALRSKFFSFFSFLALFRAPRIGHLFGCETCNIGCFHILELIFGLLLHSKFKNRNLNTLLWGRHLLLCVSVPQKTHGWDNVYSVAMLF